MTTFLYTAADRDGQTTKGERDATNEKELMQTLKLEGLFLLEAEEKDTAGPDATNFKISFAGITSLVRPVSLQDKMFFARSLAAMINAGFSLNRALEAIVQESVSVKFKKILEEIKNSVTQGKTFADSLRVHQKVFGNFFISMIEVGETSGKLSLILKLLASQMKKDNSLRKKVKGALIYPAIIIIALLGIGTLMMIYVVPTLVQTVKELGADLPLSTKIIIYISDLISNQLFFFLGGVLLFVIIFWQTLKTKAGKEISDRLIIRFPIFGPLVKKYNTARFCRSLAYLITSGMPIVRSLEITSSVLNNNLYKRAAEEAASEIQKGTQLHQILNSYPQIFQPLIIQMLSVGEETGKISEMLLRTAVFLEEDVSNTTKNLSTVIEPLLMIIIGLLVGFFVISMLQPIYSGLGNL